MTISVSVLPVYGHPFSFLREGLTMERGGKFNLTPHLNQFFWLNRGRGGGRGQMEVISIPVTPSLAFVSILVRYRNVNSFPLGWERGISEVYNSNCYFCSCSSIWKDR